MQAQYDRPNIKHYLAASVIAAISAAPISYFAMDAFGSLVSTIEGKGFRIPIRGEILVLATLSASGAVAGAFAQGLLFPNGSPKTTRVWIATMAIAWPLLLVVTNPKII